MLVLGTVPSLQSLALQQSYGHAQNLFWQFMGELFDAGRELPYAERIARLHARGVGIWDVYRSVERPGSLDSSIVRSSEVPNEIADLLREHVSIRAIALNGGRAVDILALPSTSPANASIPRAEKFRRWQALAAYAKEDKSSQGVRQ